VLDFSTELIASNEINGAINGVAISAVTFTGSHNQTIQLFKTALLALTASVKSVQVVGNYKRVKIIGVDGVTLTASTPFAVTLGASQPTITVNTEQSVSGLVDVPALIVKDVMKLGGTRKDLIQSASGALTFTKAFGITFLTDVVISAITLDANYTVANGTTITAVTFPAGTTAYINFTSIALTSGTALIHTLE
jgi:hypothetical protein